MDATALRITDAAVAFRLLAEIRRTALSSLWGDVIVVAVTGSVLVLVPSRLWASPAIRELTRRYGGELVATGVDSGDVAVAWSRVQLDVHPRDTRLSRWLSALIVQAITTWSRVRRGGVPSAANADLATRVERRLRLRYPRARIVPEPRDGNGVVWHVYRGDREEGPA